MSNKATQSIRDTAKATAVSHDAALYALTRPYAVKLKADFESAVDEMGLAREGVRPFIEAMLIRDMRCANNIVATEHDGRDPVLAEVCHQEAEAMFQRVVERVMAELFPSDSVRPAR